MLSEIEEENTPLQKRLNQLGKTLSLIALGLVRPGVPCRDRAQHRSERDLQPGIRRIPGRVLARHHRLLHPGRQPGGRGGAGRPGGRGHDQPGARHARNGEAQCPHPAAGRRRDLGQHDDHLHRQDRHLDTKRNERGADLRHRVPVRGDGRAVCAEGGDSGSRKAEGGRSEVRNRGSQALQNSALSTLLRGALLCSDAILEVSGEEGGRTTYRMVGDPTEGALVVAAAKAGHWRAEVEQVMPRVAEVPFDADRKMMTTVHRIRPDRRQTTDDGRQQTTGPRSDVCVLHQGRSGHRAGALLAPQDRRRRRAADRSGARPHPGRQTRPWRRMRCACWRWRRDRSTATR